MITRSLLILPFLCVFVAAARAATPSPYEFNSTREWSAVAGGLVIGGIGLYYDLHKTPYSPADAAQASPANIPVFDQVNAGYWNTRARDISDAVLVGSLMLPASIMIPKWEEANAIGLLYAETAILIGGSVAFAKGVVNRNRPYSYGNDAPANVRYDADTKRSFFSGHAATITGGAVLTATLFQDYFPESTYVPWVWAGALGFAAVGSSLRVMAGMHFPSDVMMGIAVGGTIAYAVPTLHKNYHRPPLAFYATPEEAGLRGHWRF